MSALQQAHLPGAPAPAVSSSQTVRGKLKEIRDRRDKMLLKNPAHIWKEFTAVARLKQAGGGGAARHQTAMCCCMISWKRRRRRPWPQSPPCRPCRQHRAPHREPHVQGTRRAAAAAASGEAY